MNKKICKVLFLMTFIFVAMFLVACVDEPPGPVIPPHDCEAGEWEDVGERICGQKVLQRKYCIICNEVLDEKEVTVKHEYVEEVIEATCTTNGKTIETCKNCDKEPSERVIFATGHLNTEFRISKEAEKDGVGEKELYCKDCNEVLKTTNYVNNGYFAHGKLSVKGKNLVDEKGKKFQLQGLSTHGLQWANQYVNKRTIEELVNEFGINVLRVAVYTDEGGYAYGGDSAREMMENKVREAAQITYELGIYLIVDWHMVGAEHEEDKNPLTHLELSKSFFSKMSKEFSEKGYEHILYEIMNEPNGATTWDHCKLYAEQVIPVIRENSDGIILVGNPKWTADLLSVIADRLNTNVYTNIMYTYHFYAADHRSTNQVITAYNNGLPVFISEYGFMNSDGDGDIDPASGENWMKVLNERNISYVAWNISNTGGSASIFKKGTQDMFDVSDSNLKEWGIYLKNMYRKNCGLDN